MNKGKAIFLGSEDEENLAIRYLGAVLKKNGHEVFIISYSKKDKPESVMDDIKSFKPDMVAVSMAFQSLARHYLDLCKIIKKNFPEIHITIGGHFPTFEYKKLMKYPFIDTVIRFDGENSIKLLMEALLGYESFSNIPQLVYRENGKIEETPILNHFPDIESLPHPLRDKTHHYRLGEMFGTLISSRGCFHSKCIYCCIGAFHRSKNQQYILRSTEDVAKEMKILYDGGIRLFQFHDDNFLLQSKEKSLNRLQSLKKSLNNKDVDFDELAILIKTRPDALDEQLVNFLKDMGIIGIFLGVENASDSGLKSLARGSSPEEIETALKLIKIHKLAGTFNLLMFHPRANLKEINENIIFMKKFDEFASDFGRAEIVAGSPLEMYVAKNNLLRGQWPQWDYRIMDDGVEKMFRLIMLTFYKPGSFYPQLSHQTIALAYHSQVLQRIHGGDIADRYQKKAHEIIKTINKYKIDNLLEIYRLTGKDDVFEEIDEVYQQMNQKFQLYLKVVNNLSQKMKKYQITNREFKDKGLEDYLQKSKLLKRFFY